MMQNMSKGYRVTKTKLLLVSAGIAIAMSACGVAAETPAAGQMPADDEGLTVLPPPDTEPEGSSDLPDYGEPISPEVAKEGMEVVRDFDGCQFDRELYDAAESDLSRVAVAEIEMTVDVDKEGNVGVFLGHDGKLVSTSCMSADTAAAHLDLGLVLASVGPAGNGDVYVALVTPAGEVLQDIPGLAEVRSEVKLDVTSESFEASVLVVSESEALPGTTDLSPSSLQLLRLVEEARSGTSSVTGLGPDLLR